ncbi:hypothetical protein B0H13DRAFT_1861365 [Mycena leptocephala]|nr:hypothetical protein B0H13DRAFT_1861365 [Mycena leptocephala]
MNGYLRQELRELEVLDEITKLRSFYAWKADHKDPVHFHPAMRWDASMGPRVPEAVEYTEWRPTVNGRNKRKRDSLEAASKLKAKRSKLEKEQLLEKENEVRYLRTHCSNQFQRNRPLGLIWDAQHYSCGYDATFTILGNLWAEHPARWSEYFAHMSGILSEFNIAMNSVLEKRITFEQARNAIRKSIHKTKPDHFPYGPNYTSVDRIMAVLFPNQRCYGMLESSLTAGLRSRGVYPDGVKLQDWLSAYLSRGRQVCPRCNENGQKIRMDMKVSLTDVPPVMVFDIVHEKLLFDDELCLEVNGRPIILALRGIIHGGQSHFTCRVIGRDGAMWFHDGITTGSSCIPEGNLRTLKDRALLHKCGEKIAVSVIYARIG